MLLDCLVCVIILVFLMDKAHKLHYPYSSAGILHWTGIWRVWRPGQRLDLFITFLIPEWYLCCVREHYPAVGNDVVFRVVLGLQERLG